MRLTPPPRLILGPLAAQAASAAEQLAVAPLSMERDGGAARSPSPSRTSPNGSANGSANGTGPSPPNGREVRFSLSGESGEAAEEAALRPPHRSVSFEFKRDDIDTMLKKKPGAAESGAEEVEASAEGGGASLLTSL